MMITGAQCRAARALVEWTREKLASNSGVDALAIEEFERRITLPDYDVCNSLQIALEGAGAFFIAENGGDIVVRLKLRPVLLLWILRALRLRGECQSEPAFQRHSLGAEEPEFRAAHQLDRTEGQSRLDPQEGGQRHLSRRTRLMRPTIPACSRAAVELVKNDFI
ncbi:hypothetical protein [Mesorhizobium abyssinicae]